MAVSLVSRISTGGLDWKTRGKFVHVGGAAEETIVVEGQVHSVVVGHNSASEPHQVSPAPFSVSVSGGLSTVTFGYQPDVADGVFEISHGYAS